MTKDNLGSVNITTNVLASIAAKAASEVEGVAFYKSNLEKQAGIFLGLDTDRFFVTAKYDEDQVSIDIKIHVLFGYNVPKIAMKVQEKIKEQILYMTDLQVSQVNVHVESIESSESLVGNGDVIG